MNNNDPLGALPDGLELARTTDLFDNDTVPAGLLRSHRVASGIWARLVVRTGSVRFVFEDDPDKPIKVEAGDSVIIAPSRPHHVDFDGPTTFAIEFHRLPGDTAVGPETTGLAARSKLDPHEPDQNVHDRTT